MDGRIQPVTHFSLVRNRAGAAAGPDPGAAAGTEMTGPGAHLVVFVDAGQLTASGRHRAFDALATFLPRAVGRDVEAEILVFESAARVRCPFTRDPAALEAALRGLAEGPAAGDAVPREREALVRQIETALREPGPLREALVDAAISEARAYCDRRARAASATLAAARLATAAFTGREGRRVLVLVTERLDPAPGRDVWDYFQDAIRRLDSNARRGTSVEINDLTWTAWDQTAAFRSLAAAANAARVMVVALDAAGLGPDAGFTADRGAPPAPLDDAQSVLGAESALGALAAETGGVALRGRNDLARALVSAEAAWTAYYSLAFESPPPREGRSASLRVEARRPGVTVRVRSALVARPDDLSVAEAVVAGIGARHTENPLRASLHVGEPSPSGAEWILPLEFRVPYESLTLVRGGNVARGALVLHAAAGAPGGAASPVTVQRAPVETGADAALAGTSFTYATSLRVRAGTQVLSLALTDEISRRTSYVQTMVVIGRHP